ncbi:MAG: phage holin family protein [Bacteroidia bacterium]
MNIILKLLATTLAVIITTYILPGVEVDNFLIALLVAVVLSFLNAFLKPLLVILTLPITVLTLGLFLLIINALIIILTAAIVPGFKVDGFLWALAFSIILSLVSMLMDWIAGGTKKV